MKEESLFGYIYAIDLPKGVKIGYSKTPEKRVKRIKIANGVSCAKHFISDQVFKPRSVEGSVHLSLAEFRGISEFFSVNFDFAVKEIMEKCRHVDADDLAKASILTKTAQVVEDGFLKFMADFVKSEQVAELKKLSEKIDDIKKSAST